MKKQRLKKYYYCGLIYLSRELLRLLALLTIIVGDIWETSVSQYYSLNQALDQPLSQQPVTSDLASSPQDFELYIEWKKVEPSKSTTTSASPRKRSRAKPDGGNFIAGQKNSTSHTKGKCRKHGKRSNKKRSRK